jgi:anaerobic selenocysteine-containing dehydrogenase
MAEISKSNSGLKGLCCPDTESTEVDIHAPGVEMIKSLCYFCHANCGVLAYVKDGDVIKIEGDPDYSNQGGLCCRGTSALLHVNHPARINHALKRVGEKGEGKWEQIDYDQAIQEVADRLNQIKAESGAEAVASCGGTTRTDDWARRRFLNQFGTPNGFHNALLCWIPTFMAETCVAGWSPFETDLGGAKSLILWGMNPGASTLGGMHGYTDLQKAGLKIIMVDPRYSETASKADLWLPLRPGSDAALALAMLHTIIYSGMCDYEFIEQYCDGFEELMEHVADYSPEWAAPITWLDPQQIRDAAAMYALNRPGCIQWGCTWDQIGRASTTGSHAIALLRAVTGNLDVPGGDGMPGPAMNFMTDEELELNELLPEEMKSKQIGSDRFKLTSWPGYSIISETAKNTWGKTLPTEWFCEAHGPSVFKAILTGDPYQVRALIVNASNPINSYGDAKMTLQAIKQCEFLVCVDYWMTPTALFADYVFPAAGALERPIICTHYGATDSVMGGRRAIQPKYDRHTDMTFWRKLGLACGQDPANWQWETEEEAYYAIIEGLGLPISSWNEFVDNVRMYYPPLHQKKYEKDGFWTPSRKVEFNSSILRELGYPGMPTYIGTIENEIDTPELLDEYPLCLTTGGGFMPYHHSEHFQMQHFRYIYPDPFFSINPETAKEYGIEYGDWCWIETRRGRIKMRANVEPEVAPKVIFCPRGWWFPERDGSADLDNPFGCLESNVNVLTSVDVEHCDPMGGSWANRGLLCKVYKCTELDHEYTKKDTLFSIPGSASEPGIHIMPSEEKLAREPIPFTPPECDFEFPQNVEPPLKYDWKRKKAVQEKTGYIYDESGWLIDPKTKAYHDTWTGWRYDGTNNILIDDATGKQYTMERVEIPYVGPVRAYPGEAQAPYGIPDGFTWDSERGVAVRPGAEFEGKIFDPTSGWAVDPATSAKYDPYTGWWFNEEYNLLQDSNNKYYDLSDRSEIIFVGSYRTYPGCETPKGEVPEGFVWDSKRGYITKPGHEELIYDANQGWLVDPNTNTFYDAKNAWRYDAATGHLVDDASGKQYTLTYEEVTE